MTLLKWLIVILALLESGWLAFDGAHAFATGDYVTPRTGPHAGQLGPWSKLVKALGIDPRSVWVKSIHLGLGLVWIVMIGGFLTGQSWGWTGMVVCAVLGLWYLPLGTLLGVVQIVLLALPAVRSSG